MIKIFNAKNLQRALVLVLVLTAVAYIVRTTSGYVSAYRSEQTVHIFPTQVSAKGWSNQNAVFAQEVSAVGPLQNFSRGNSAWISIGSSTPPAPIVPVPTPTVTPVLPTSTPATVDSPTVTPGVEPAPAEVPTTTPEVETVLPEPAPAVEPEPSVDVSTEPASSAGSDQFPIDIPMPEVVVPAPTDTPAPAPTTEPAPEPTTRIDVARNSILASVVTGASHAFSFVIPTAYATTSDGEESSDNASSTTVETLPTTTAASTPAVVVQDIPDVAVCTNLGKDCHTIELSGFGVEGKLSDQRFQKAELNLSFASFIRENEHIDDRLLVRYYHAGKWHPAGEIYLNKEISNESNGGYFTSELEEVGAWRDLSDVRVVVEYDRGSDNTAPSEVYLDSAWVSVSYKDRIQGLVPKDAEDVSSDASNNVTFELTAPEDKTSQMLTPDGKDITFPFVDSLDDTGLVVRADKDTYDAGDGVDSVAYVSITNTKSDTDLFDLYAAFAEKGGNVKEIAQFLRNVPEVTEIPLYDDVTYFCDGGWVKGADGITYDCANTVDTKQCSWLSETKENCQVNNVVVSSEKSTDYKNAWVPIELTSDEVATSRLSNGAGSFKAQAVTQHQVEILPGQTVYFRVSLSGTDDGKHPFKLVAQGVSGYGDLDMTMLKDESSLVSAQATGIAALQTHVNEQLSGRKTFDGDELPEFKFKFTSQRNFFMRSILSLARRNTFKASAQVRHESGEVEDVPATIEYGKNGEWTLALTEHPRAFRPGKYSIEIAIKEGSQTYTDTADFYWGVLAINTDKSSYEPGNEVNLMMAALDDRGDTICDADLVLSVLAPDGTLSDIPVVRSGLCAKNNVVDVADYLATTTAVQTGLYGIDLAEYDAHGNVVHRTTDSFKVEEKSPFVISRKGATRIYPVSSYSMDIDVTAAMDFEGEFIEAMPSDFEVLDRDGAEVRMYGSAKNLAWPLKLKEGETAHFRYVYDAPDISPYLYTLGPAEIRASAGIPFSEGKQWKLASDATGNMLLYWDQTYIPTGWTCVSCLVTDVFYQRFVMGSSTAGTNGGAATHTPTATGAVAASAASQGVDTNKQATPVVAHTHTYTPTIAAASNLPVYRQLAIIQSNTVGEPSSIPAGAIAMFDAAVPSGWTRYAAQDGAFVRSESTSTAGVAAGSNTHTHAISGNTGNAATTANIRNPGTSVTVAAAAHTHTVSTTTVSISNTPPYVETVFGKITATSSPTNDMIAMWSGDPSAGWTTVSSSSETYANKFPLASTTYGATGGASTHTHTNITGIISGAPSATVARDSTPATTNAATAAHTHNVNVTFTSVDSNLPPYRTAVFAKRVGGAAPNAPTLHDMLFDSEKTGTSTPIFTFTTSDPDGGDTLTYQFQWDDDSDLDTSPIGDRTSDVETGCSPNCFSNTVTPLNSSPFNEAEKIQFSIQTPLVSGTTYYWRVRAKESGGGGAWGSWATTTSFTYVANTAPSQWYQTEDGQFDSDTKSSVETFGSNSARLALNAPTEALIAYGEGTVQTPRYRLWNGTAWGSELSAQSVGGTIRWVVTKAAPTRNEYVLATLDDVNDINVQVYDGGAGTWGNLWEVTTGASNSLRRGVDVAYESQSGDAIAVYCDGDADPSYYVWNGTSWTFGGSVDITSANNCEYIKLASDPISDEIMLVERDTGAAYEAQVWSGSAWGNSKVLGSMTDTDHEGMAVEYEESGNQAMVVSSNGNTSGFRWATWDGSSWSIITNQTLGDDFEWGRLRADVGSDKLALCYIDEDADIGTLVWDGNAWATFVAATNERDTGGNAKTDRAADCAYETTAGRDGYLMLSYSDTTNGRYQDYNGTVWSAESSISTAQDSWTVNNIRTGDGVILTFFHDDVNARYDVSSWNGAAWSTLSTLESTMSVTVTPFLQPIDMTAKIYRAGSGTITSGTIDFDSVPGRSTWGDVIWHTTEPSGTDAKIQVMYESAGTCSTLVPDGTLPGNSTGFDVSSSPLNISGLSTSTYNRICLKSTLSTGNLSQPTLDDWTVTWERQPYFTQTHFRWYANSAASLDPSDPWPSGATDAAEDSSVSGASAPIPNDVMRLRMSISAANVALPASEQLFKLQYAESSSCPSATNWMDVGAVGSTTAKWRGYDNGSLSDGSTITALLLNSADVSESYEEENDSVLNPNSISVGDEGEWDWVLQHNASSTQSYCFRVVSAGGEVLDQYDTYPALSTNSSPSVPSLSVPFDNEAVASTTPWFEFASEDPESDDITYQMQIDDDSAFGSVDFDRNSQSNLNDFNNIATPADKDPFNSGQSIRFIPASALSNGVTYYWRVRAKDRNRSNEWSAWSDVRSLTIDTSVTISTWKETTLYQFANDTLEDTEATSTNEIVITPPLVNATATGPLIDYDWKTSGNAWGELSWNDNEAVGDIKYHIEYFDGTDWVLIPDSDLAGNAAGYDTSPISLLGVSPTAYNQIHVRADMTNVGGTPRLSDWTVRWGIGVPQPTLTAPFDNEKVSTTTPYFKFSSTDPENDDLIYQFSYSSSPLFTSSTTHSSNIDTGFENFASSSDISPFASGSTTKYTLQFASPLTNGNTYWWRARARDPSGGNAWSPWSDAYSLTVDTAVIVSTWFQSTTEQFDTDTLNDTEANSGTARIAATNREAMVAYAETTVQTPRFKFWNGISWGSKLSGVSVGDTIRFVEAAAAPTRDEYAIATQGATGGVNVQIVNGTTDAAGNKVSMVTAVTGLTQRGVDVTYETISGDAMVVSCSGTQAVYRTWNGSAWSATSSITLAIATNCQWVKLAADPVSDEIILVVRDQTTGTVDYEALVWNGSSWGNPRFIGSQVTVNDEGIAVEYEESGDQAVVAVSDGANNDFAWTTWSGSAWSATSTRAIGNDFAGGRIKRDAGSDNMVMCYIDIDSDIGISRWDGSTFLAFQEFETLGNSLNGRPQSCEFETTAGRDGYIIGPYTNTTIGNYVVWDGASLTGPFALSTLPDSWEVRSVRTDDGNILVAAYNDADTEYDFSYWNGTTWSALEVLDANSITTVVPATIPIDIVARKYPEVVSGNVASTPIVFTSGLGPKWGSISYSKSTPGLSTFNVQVEYLTSTSSWALIPDVDLSGNSIGTTTSPVDISNLNYTTYGTLRLKANFACAGVNCPTLNDWTLQWSEGVHVSGTAKQFDQTTNVTSGTAQVAVNGAIQVGKTATISGGTFDIPNVTAFTGDIVTVFIDGANDASEAVAVTKYDGVGDMTGLKLYEGHVTLGSVDNPTLTNANIGIFDNTVSGDEDIFYDVDAGNDLNICSVTGCFNSRLLVQSGTTYRPDSSSSGNVTSRNLQIDGTLVADGNSFFISGSWKNNSIFTADTSTVVFTATSTSETVDSITAATSTFYAVTFGQTSGTATWTLSSDLLASSTVSVNFGTLAQSNRAIVLSSNLSFGVSGAFTKGAGTTTFMGSGSNTWTDNTVAKQDLGEVVIDGSPKTIALGSGVKATNITIGTDDTLTAGASFSIDVVGNWINNNVFTAQTGTVNFVSTSAGRTITQGSSNFYNLTFNGVAGNWAFTGANLGVDNNFTVSTGTVAMPTGTTTVAGSFDTNGGTFMHNNGVVLMTASGAKTVRPGASSFYDLTFNGSGSWTFVDANATTSRNTFVLAGTMTAPSGTLAIGGSFARNGGTFTHNSGTLKFTAASSKTIRLNGQNASNITFDGVGGAWSFVDTFATTTGSLTVLNGYAALASSTLAVGGSFDSTAGTFNHASGTVRFFATAAGKTIAPGASSFANLVFDSASGGWTITGNATSTASTTITNASSLTLSSGSSLEVKGGFTNSIGGANTTWTGSTLYLNSGTSYSINTKTTGGDAYGTLLVGANTNIRSWNSDAATTTTLTGSSVYSQDNNAVDGALSIYGTYARASGTDYWSYATDFDGVALGGSSRQVTVRAATSSTMTFSGGALNIVGASGATTTIRTSGSTGTYGFAVTGGTLNASFYRVQNTDASGLTLSGTPTVTSLADGDFELSTNSGSLITVASTVIDANPLAEFQRVRFATTTGITAGFNVTETGTPASYWWFRSHYGNFAGESYDNDPGGDPGHIHWDDSGFTISVAGTVYTDEGVTHATNPLCDGSTPVVKLVVSGAASYTASCASGSGAYLMPAVQFSGDAVFTVFLDTNGGTRAATVTRTPSVNLTGLDLYQNALVVRHEGSSALTIANLAQYDSSDDSDIAFTATTGSPDALVLEPDNELYVLTGKTFAPGGNVTLTSGGSGTNRDARLFVATSSVYAASTTESHSIGGNLVLSGSSTFTTASTTFTFTATTTGKSIYTAQPITFYDATFNGSGANWNFVSATTSTTTVSHALTLTAGTISGTSDIKVSTGGISGLGTVAMTGGTVRLEGTGSFGNGTAWQFFNLILGNGSGSGTITKSGAGTTTISNVLTVATNEALQAGSSDWVLSKGGTPFIVNGLLTVQTAPFYYTATTSTSVKATTYAALTLAPAAAGTPTFTLLGGTLAATNLTIGGANPVTVTADTNDPSLSITGDVTIGSSSTLIASNVGALDVGGSWTNAGTFTHSSNTVRFNGSAVGKTITPGSSSFYNLTIDGPTGGWTINGNATSTNNTTLTNATSFTVSPNVSLAVLGTFTNSVGGSNTTWATSTLFLNSGTSYSLNTKTAATEVYGTLLVGANTDVRMWNSSAATTSVNSTGSLYSQDHAAVDGSLYIWGEYIRSSGSDYWSYATDFDGTSLGGSSRQVNVRVATSSSISMTAGVLDILGAPTASTTIQVQSTGNYSFGISGGTVNASYYVLRDTDANGLNLTGSPTVTSLSRGDFLLGVNGGTTMTVAGSVITTNPLKIMLGNKFATSTGITSGSNVKVTGTTGSFWKFNLHYGAFGGESYDDDPGGNPGYVRWDDSDGNIVIAGTVYSDEGSTVSTVCDNSTQVVHLMVEAAGSYTGSCNSSTGAYTISNVSYNPGDNLTVYLDTNGGRRGANISTDPSVSISGMDIYEDRVIVRHEDTAPLTIADMAIFDHDGDSDIPFNATDAGSDTLVVEPDTKLIVWTSKTFAPAGDITLQSGGSGNVWDGSLQLFNNAVFSSSGTQSHTIGGNLTVGTGASLQAASTTFTFTATTTGKTITPNGSSFYNLVFNGSGGNWAFSNSTATTSNDFTITTGTVTLPTATTTVGGSFQNNGGTFMHNNGAVVMSSTASGKTVKAGTNNPFYTLAFNGVGGVWTMTDTNATSSNNFTITNGSVTAPTGVLAVGGSFQNSGTYTNSSGTLKLTAVSAGKFLQTGSSNLYNLLVNGSGGAWTWSDTNATTTNTITISSGTLTLPAGTLAILGSFDSTGGAFTPGTGTVRFAATATGKTVTPSASSFYNLVFDSSTGGWTVNGNATSTNNTSILNASSFTLSPSVSLGVSGAFTNSVGGSNTTFANSTLFLNSASTYSINTKTAATEVYGTLLVGANTDVRMWNSSAATTSVNTTGSLYSQDHAAVDGSLAIYGEYVRTSGTEYWTYATDFDGIALGGSSRQVTVRVATSSTLAFSGGTLNMTGAVGATTTVRTSGSTGTYSFAISGGTIDANYYRVQNTDTNGLSISGAPAITSLSNGDYELSTDGGAMMTVAAAAIDANASLSISNVRFATSTGVASGYNVTRTGTPINAWTFTGHYGNYAGENYDNDGGDACGKIRWDDSTCLLVSQDHYRWRADDGGEGAPSSDWYDLTFAKRQKIGITNNVATVYTNLPVKFVVSYDGDMQSDFDDLRFTDSSGTTTLHYWIESSTASASSTVWVKVPSLPASGSAVIYMYYGNNSTTTSSSGTNTFKFFDDFEDNNITEYSGNTTLFTTSTNFNHNGTYGLDAGSNFDQRTTGGIYRTGSLSARGDTVSFYQYVDNAIPDEPCTLFGVQGSGSNYAVCLDQDPSDKLAISKNVTSNDEGGTVLASTTLSWATGWYQVKVDWLTTNAIDVNVYNSSGTLFATATASDATWSSGGIGFSYWFMYGGWDTYTVKQYVATDPSYKFGVEQTYGGATWYAAEDTSYTTRSYGNNLRLRFSIQNTASAVFGRLFRLQYAPKASALNCESVPYVNYNDVPTHAGGCGSSAACMASTTNYASGDVTAGLLTYPASATFNAGSVIEEPSNQTASSTVSASGATEVEYNFQMTANATDNTYCFRASNGGSDLDNYTHVAELDMIYVPIISNHKLNNDADIALTEGASTTIAVTATVTDQNGYADLSLASSTVYRSGVGSICSADANSCYRLGTSSCSYSSCSGASCTLTCNAHVQYIADPTDVGSTYSAESWLSELWVTDLEDNTATSSSISVDLLTLYGLTVNTANIDFGSLSAGSTTGNVNATTTIQNTGNTNINISVAGTDLAGTQGTIAVGEIKYATTTFAYGSCAVCQFLTGGATPVVVDLPKPTSTSTPITDDLYWGLNIPDGTSAELHSGTNTFLATSP